MSEAEGHTDVAKARLGDLLVGAQAGFASGERAENGVIQLRMNNVDTQGRFVWDRFLRVPASPGMIDEYRLRRGDVVFNNTNSTELVGKSALFDGHAEPIVYSNHFTRLRVRPDALDPGYLSAWLNHEWQRGTFAEICNRWIGQSAVKADKLLALEIPLPPLAEQERIAGRLTEQLAAVERARAATEARLAAAIALPAALLREVFEGPEATGWEKVPLRDIAAVSGGLQKQPKRAAHTFHRPYLTVRNVQRGSLDLSQVERFEITPSELDRLRLMRGDILIVEGNGSPDQIGRNAVFDLDGEEWIHQNHVIRVRLSGRADYQFVSRYLNSDGGRRQMLERAQSTSGLHTLSVEKVGSLTVPQPDPVTQRRIAESLSRRLAAGEHLAAGIREELAAIEALPAALLREAFRTSD